MDDPWGSPWATTNSPKDQTSTLPHKSDIAPPHTFISPSPSPRLHEDLKQSPWDSDDAGFGEWAGRSDEPLGHSVWNNGWEEPCAKLTSTPHGDRAPDAANRFSWAALVATPKGPNDLHLLSAALDPWAIDEAVEKALADKIIAPEFVRTASPVQASPSSFDTQLRGTMNRQSLDLVESSGKSKDQYILGSVSGHPLTGGQSAAEREGQSSGQSLENTDREDERQDYPIAPADDDAGSLRPALPKSSGKVQELVVKFDGLARAAIEEHLAIQQHRIRSRSPADSRMLSGVADDTEFGDFEDADQKDLALASDCAQMSEASTTLKSPNSSTATAAAAANPDALNFSVDFSLVDKLFKVPMKRSSAMSVMNADIPDRIIEDNFRELSQRRTWYRISRLGSCRRHAAADDDSYRRVLWRSSVVHNETIKIVRRWMEEDSLIGRATLGGGKTQKNMFGWDSPAEPVTLDEVFRKPKSHSTMRCLQLPSANVLSRSGSGDDSPHKLGHCSSGSVGSGVVAFSWSTTSPMQSTHGAVNATQAGISSDSAVSVDEVPDASSTLDSISPAALPSRQTLSSATALTPPSITNYSPRPDKLNPKSEHDDDNEEWGDMVSSPAASNPTVNSLNASWTLDIIIPVKPPVKVDGVKSHSDASHGDDLRTSQDAKPVVY
ncbi:uncharacterized protein CTHT_0069090 [Thermochaetoides thermophila DSM 1495]|uniref:Uncharacterized protein n=1 Tax=Chaetomium thermophilum (strain DSM 1495 / CBS 144.50 / IMI 039719) TaxID=759272 RepID=G0SH85_CHATD|nr:hypothetical protein CTHT_0069090 [Thermochaetoides thermophila DSM 1495]EGS17574.1 hypothetical protein CTHT_0069090 [Thermochaetoides thermophila DSM 1495]